MELDADVISPSDEIDVPFVSSSEMVTGRLLEIVKLRATDLLFDLGSGDGRIVIAGAQNYGAKCIGIERRKELVQESTKKIKDLALRGRATVILGDFRSIDLSKADVIVSYLLTVVNKQLENKLENELKAKARVISHDFEFPDWKPTEFTEINEGWLDHKVYLYTKDDVGGFKKKPQKAEPTWRPL
jgi:cyclopropane fatty-acyl-phospholipid synthase-like methyltransferase